MMMTALGPSCWPSFLLAITVFPKPGKAYGHASTGAEGTCDTTQQQLSLSWAQPSLESLWVC